MIESITYFIKNTPPNDNTYYEYIIDGNSDYGLPSFIEYVSAETDGKETLTEEAAWEAICNAMDFYLLDFKGTISEKQKLWEFLSDWLRCISGSLGEGYSLINIDAILPAPIEKDLPLEILKDLHYSKKGVAKSELASKYNVSEKTIKEIINKIDASNKDNELRVAGQKIDGRIIHEDRCDSDNSTRYRYFSLKSTINPVFLQMNIAQVHSLINGLKCSYYIEGRNMSLSNASEIWRQLSDYTKCRIWDVYCKKDPQLMEFIQLVEEDCTRYTIGKYYSESEQLDEEDLSYDEIKEIKEKLGFYKY